MSLFFASTDGKTANGGLSNLVWDLVPEKAITGT